MTRRRRLIVVSNRGPVTYGRDAQAAARRPAGRRRARDGAARPPRAARRDVDRERDDRRGSASAVRGARRGGRRDGARRARSGCLRRLLQRGREPAALVSAALPVGAGARRPCSTGSSTPPGSTGYAAVNRNFAGAVVAELDNSPDAVVCFHDYHLYLAPAFVRAQRPAARLAHFVHVPWPVDWACCRRRCAGPCTRACSRTTSSASTRSGGARTSVRSCEDVGVECTARGHSHRADLDRRRRVRGALASSDAVLAGGGVAARAPARAARGPRRPNGSVEEHRARLPGLRRAARRSPRSGAAG